MSRPKPKIVKPPFKLTVKGRKFIERHEGLSLCPLKAHVSEQYWTVGYGHYGPDVKPGVCITQAQASRLLTLDARAATAAVEEALASHARQVRQQEVDALVSAVYNLGPGLVLDESYSTLARRLDSKEARSITGRDRIYRQELPKWIKAGGETLPGLVQRRKDEIRLACLGRYEQRQMR